MFQIAYMPYLGFRTQEVIHFTDVELTNADDFLTGITDPDLKARIQALLTMHRIGPDGRKPAAKIDNMGIVTVAARDFREMTAADQAAIQEFRSALFLACLANTARLKGPNAGHFAFTSENFRIVTQNFELDNDRIAEVSGVLVTQTLMGYRISEHRFPKPSYVHIPLSFTYDTRLFDQLRWLRKHSPSVLRRILRATSVFLESYYNTPAVDVNARILLQASAFEILLDLPDREPRRQFKDRIEQHCCQPGERKRQYTFEVRGKRLVESRTVKGLWADRFYTLRNHIIHGHVVRQTEFVFRALQHHLVIAPLFLVLCVEQMVNAARIRKGRKPALFDRLIWTNPQSRQDEDEDEQSGGFRLEPNFGALFSAPLRKHAARKQMSAT